MNARSLETEANGVSSKDTSKTGASHYSDASVEPSVAGLSF